MVTARAPGSTAWVPLAEVHAWDRNPRNNDPAIRPVAESIRRFGFVAPVVVWASRGRLVAGHTRLAALRLCLTEDPVFVPRGAPEGTLPGFAPVHFHEFATEEEATAYGIADNRLNELATWDTATLDTLLRELPPVLCEVTGFDLPDLAAFTLPADPAPTPAASDSPKAAPGPAPAAGTVAAGSPAEEWEGMPEYASDAHKPHKSITVHFRNEADFAEFVRVTGTASRNRFMWFPDADPADPERAIGLFSDRVYK